MGRRAAVSWTLRRRAADRTRQAPESADAATTSSRRHEHGQRRDAHRGGTTRAAAGARANKPRTDSTRADTEHARRPKRQTTGHRRPRHESRAPTPRQHPEPHGRRRHLGVPHIDGQLLSDGPPSGLSPRDQTQARQRPHRPCDAITPRCHNRAWQGLRSTHSLRCRPSGNSLLSLSQAEIRGSSQMRV